MKSTIRFPFLASTLAVVALGAVACSSSSSTPTSTPDAASTDDSGDDSATATDGGAGDGTVADGATTDGATTDGATTDGATTDGATTDGATTDGATTDGATTDGATTDGATTDGAAVSDGGDAAIADLPVPDLTGVCPENAPTNVSFAAAAPLPTLDAYGRVRVGAGVTTGNDEWFSFDAPKHDPVWVEVNYTVAAGNTSTLTLNIDNLTDNNVAYDDTARALPSQTLSTIYEPAAAGSAYYVDIGSNTATCTPFDLYVRALYCTDSYEDNDDDAHSVPVTLTATANATGGTSTAAFGATIDGLDDDWYSFAAPKADPMSFTVTYTPTSTETLNLNIENATLNNVGYDDTGTTLNTVVESTAAGAIYHVGVHSTLERVCTNYQTQINALWCTDAFEDNDTFATAATLPGATAENATITSLDDDYYLIASATSGSCTVTYTVPQGVTQQLELTLYDVNQSTVTYDDTARSALTQTLTASWTSQSAVPVYAYVHATGQGSVCTSYTINCN